jgi:hypothetical protein
MSTGFPFTPAIAARDLTSNPGLRASAAGTGETPRLTSTAMAETGLV